MAENARRHKIVTTVKYGLGIAMLGWLIYSVDIDRAVSTLGQISGMTIFLVVVLSLLGILITAVTWYPLVTRFAPVSIPQLLTADLTIKFVNTLSPSRLSGRMIAPLTLRHHVGLDWNEAVAITVAHTGLYAILYGTFTLLGLILDAEAYGPGLTTIIFLSAGAYVVVGGTIVLSGWRLDLFDQLFSRINRTIERVPGGRRLAAPMDSFRTKLLDGSDWQFRQLLSDAPTIGLFTGAWMGALLVIPALRVWVLLSAMGVTTLGPLLLPLYLIVAYSVTVLPLTPGGIGIAEATAVAVFVSLGVPEEAIVTVVFLDRIFGVYLPAIVGWIPLIRTDFESVIS